MFAAFLAYSWNMWNSHNPLIASLASVRVLTGSALYLFMALGIESSGSFALSHITYFSAVRAKR